MKLFNYTYYFHLILFFILFFVMKLFNYTHYFHLNEEETVNSQAEHVHHVHKYMFSWKLFKYTHYLHKEENVISQQTKVGHAHNQVYPLL